MLNAEDGPVDVHILATSMIRIETCPQLQEGGHSARDADGPAGGLQDSRYQLKKGALP